MDVFGKDILERFGLQEFQEKDRLKYRKVEIQFVIQLSVYKIVSHT